MKGFPVLNSDFAFTRRALHDFGLEAVVDSPACDRLPEIGKEGTFSDILYSISRVVEAFTLFPSEDRKAATLLALETVASRDAEYRPAVLAAEVAGKETGR